MQKKNFILYDIIKNKKANSCGFWKDANGKIFRDKIEKISLSGEELYKRKKALFASGEKAVMYTDFQTAIIENEKGQKEFLRQCITWQEKKLTASFVKELLKQNGGLTITRGFQNFTLEIWKA